MNRKEFIQKFSILSLGLANFSFLFSNNQKQYKDLQNDPEGILALPKGFTYDIISKEKQVMDDGLLVPSNADGMACFKGKGDNLILIRNHEIGHVPELSTFFKNNPYGKKFKRYIKKNSNKFYDIKKTNTHCFGGTTTIVYNPIKNKLKVNESRVIFTNPKTLREETVDVSRLIRVFVNNYESHKRSVK